MQLSSKALHLKPVLDSKKEKIIAIMKEAVISLETGKLIGILCLGNKVISFNDLIWNENERYFYVKDESALCQPEEILRLDEALKTKNYFRKQKVITEDKKKIGKLKDVIIDPVQGTTLAISVVRRVWFSKYELLVHRNNILKADSKTISIRNPKLETKQKAATKLEAALETN